MLGLSYLESYMYSCVEGYTTTDELCTVCQPDGSLSLLRSPACYGKKKIVFFLLYFGDNLFLLIYLIATQHDIKHY